ncbi:hypothetical protein FNV43_RR09737 [Rhamnella rubrinervis]|uniref:PAR1 protein n=1 Tax=Rhamnella rubrinervis TaxID=2594499 RepID=A0A8K0HBB8_9ROSA|nr:hypothetical protein FNV43_RR09737 [Rhamnella rubrinervis]
MALISTKLPLVLFFSSLFVHAALGEIVCEDLPKDMCAFSIASSGKRCLLETTEGKDGHVEYQCRTSEVVVERMSEHIETEQCVKACGVDRNSVGISSDCLLESRFMSKLCSPACYQNCANIVDLYFNLAAGEGVFLPELCEKQRANPHRSMVELMSSGAAAGPAFQDTTGAPGPAYQESTGAPGPAYQSSSTGDAPESPEAPGPASQDFFEGEEEP